jgi:release factor glutamine methyltransferase
MTVQEAQQKLLTQLYRIYEHGEAAAISNLVMENITGWKRIDRVLNKTVLFSLSQTELFGIYYKELSEYRPVQYVLRKTRFCGMEFYVDENVLIPRPETEELVNWIVADANPGLAQYGVQNSSISLNEQDLPHPYKSENPSDGIKIIDIGTGSGCIPIALKKKLPDADIWSCDRSEKALAVAEKNAIANNTEISFICLDFLDVEKRASLPSFNIIASNPPYIPQQDKSSMPKNVVDFEPSIALFVDDNDPFVFYRAIADFGNEKLLKTGAIYVEIHEDFFPNVKELFLQKGFSTVTVKKDIHGKNRMVKATLLL